MYGNEYKNKSLDELMIEFTLLEQEINLKLIKYEKMRKEICKRFPVLKEEDFFKEKILIKKEK